MIRSTALLALLWASALPANAQARLLRTPAIHGDTIVYSYGGDLWSARKGSASAARRLTSHPGVEIRPKISADGRWIAFTGSYDGAAEVYLLPIEGGEARRLTFDGRSANVLGWTADGRIAYASSVGNFTQQQRRLWLVPPDGGLPERTPVAEVMEASFGRDGTMAYTRAASFDYVWRNYRGGKQARVSLYDLQENRYRELPSGSEQKFFPMLAGRAVYYISDRRGGRLNLYRYDVDAKRETQLTHYTDADIRWPGTDGKSIVWERDGYLEVFEIASGKVERQSPRMALEPLRPAVRKLADFMSALSFTGTRVAVEARGEIFAIPVQGGETVNLTRTAGARERMPRWSPDGKSLAYISDATGNSEIYLDAERLTNANGTMTFTALKWSPDGKLLELRTVAHDVYLLDVQTRELIPVLKAQLRDGSSDWSPDSRRLALVEYGSYDFGAVRLYDVASRKLHGITDGRYSDRAVAFDLSGKELYLVSSRTFSPVLGRFEYNLDLEESSSVYAISLSADADALPDAAQAVPLPVPPGKYETLIGIRGGVVFVTGERIAAFDRGSGETRTLYEGSSLTLAFDPARTQLAVLDGSAINVLDVRGGAPSRSVNTAAVEAAIDLPREWRQIYREAWRYARDSFYDPALHDVDWPAAGRRYEAWLPFVRHRSDLNYVIRLLLGELGASHTSVEGGDMGFAASPTSVGWLGADYAADGDAVRFAKIHTGAQHDPALRGPLAGLVHAGEYLLEIDGRRVTVRDHPNRLLLNKANQDVTLTVNTRPTMEGARRVTVKTLAGETRLRSWEWIESARRRVAERSGGRIGYIYLPNVVHEGIAAFAHGIASQSGKAALIVDERWNGGGFLVQQSMIELLTRRPYMGMRARNGTEERVGTAVEGPKVMLINEYAGSGGDSVPWTFRQAAAGTLIGRRTAGAGLGADDEGLLLADGGYVSVPGYALYDRKTGALATENTGVAPDIEVDLRPDLAARGEDPQLDAAIDHLLKELGRRSPGAW